MLRHRWPSSQTYDQWMAPRVSAVPEDSKLLAKIAARNAARKAKDFKEVRSHSRRAVCHGHPAQGREGPRHRRDRNDVGSKAVTAHHRHPGLGPGPSHPSAGATLVARCLGSGLRRNDVRGEGTICGPRHISVAPAIADWRQLWLIPTPARHSGSILITIQQSRSSCCWWRFTLRHGFSGICEAGGALEVSHDVCR